MVVELDLPAGFQITSVLAEDELTVEPPRNETSTEAGRRTLRVCYGGGDGYGDPHLRDRAAILADVADELVSSAAAESVYGLDATGADRD